MTDYTLATLLHPDVLAEYSEEVIAQDVEAGNLIAVTHDGAIHVGEVRSNSAAHPDLGDPDEDREIELTSGDCIALYNSTPVLRKLTPPTPQWPEMAPLTSLGQMAEGTIKGKPARILVVATWLTSEPTYSVVPSQPLGAWNDSTLDGSWKKVSGRFDPGTLHPITAEPVELSDGQVRMLPAETWLINGGDEWCTANNAWTFMEDAPFSLIHYPKENSND